MTIVAVLSCIDRFACARIAALNGAFHRHVFSAREVLARLDITRHRMDRRYHLLHSVSVLVVDYKASWHTPHHHMLVNSVP